jgi:hypothetical protein
MLTSLRPFAFVLMPFAARHDDVYPLAIQAACDDAGAYAERVFNQIARADLVVADRYERNADVFGEVGHAASVVPGGPACAERRRRRDRLCQSALCRHRRWRESRRHAPAPDRPAAEAVA